MIGVGVLFAFEDRLGRRGFKGGNGGKTEAIGVEAGHELPGVDDFGNLGGGARVGEEGARENGAESEAARRRRWGLRGFGVMRRSWIEGEKAIGGGGEGDDVLTQC